MTRIKKWWYSIVDKLDYIFVLWPIYLKDTFYLEWISSNPPEDPEEWPAHPNLLLYIKQVERCLREKYPNMSVTAYSEESEPKE